MERKPKILIIEDEQSMREVLKMLLEGEGYDVTSAVNGGDGAEWIGRDIFDLVITDIKMPVMDGFGILGKCMEVAPETLVIMITAFGTTEAAIEAMKLGAYDYVHKPFKIDEIRLIVKNALDKRRLRAEVSLLREKVREVSQLGNIIGKSPSMQEIMVFIPKVASSTASVLITGESGTGKDLVANALHNFGDRAEKNFVAVNCASFPEGLLESELFGHMKGAFTGAIHNKQGLFEVADGGTLFLDEVADLPINLQPKLLRAIETGTFRRVGGTADVKVNVRVVAATNRDLASAVSAGAFREDLFYRLNVVPIRIPPIRERREDIPFLVEHFLRKHSPERKRSFSAGALSVMMNCEWKGNVRQMENIVERTLLLYADKDIITEAELPPDLTTAGAGPERLPQVDGGVNLEEIMEKIEKGYMLEALKLSGGKKTEAARLLGLSFRAFRHKLYKYGMK